MAQEIVRKLIDGVWRTVRAPGGGGGGSQTVLVATKTLNNAEILALPTTSQTIVATPGSGKAALPLVAYLATDFSVGYAGIAAAANYPTLWVDLDTFATLTSIQDQDGVGAPTLLTYFLSKTTPSFSILGLSVGFAGVDFGTVPAVGADLTTYEDRAIEIATDNGSDFTGGDVANSLTATVLYTVIDV